MEGNLKLPFSAMKMGAYNGSGSRPNLGHKNLSLRMGAYNGRVGWPSLAIKMGVLT